MKCKKAIGSFKEKGIHWGACYSCEQKSLTSLADERIGFNLSEKQRRVRREMQKYMEDLQA